MIEDKLYLEEAEVNTLEAYSGLSNANSYSGVFQKELDNIVMVYIKTFRKSKSEFFKDYGNYLAFKDEYKVKYNE